MRQRALVLSLSVAMTAALAGSAAAQMPGNARGEAKATFAGKTVVIDYGRPSLKGRDMLGKAEIGQEWRMGADAATTLDTDVALHFGKTVVPAGKYILRAKKASATEWLLKFDADGKPVAEVPLTATTLESPVEVFTIDLSAEKGDGVFKMSWGTTGLQAKFSAK
jgi:hypothetical protein